jgi:hypothetical protein
MAKRLQTFLKDVKALRASAIADKSALLQRLKAMTPEEFVHVPREDLQELTDKQYAEIVQHVTKGHRLAEPSDMAPRIAAPWSRLSWKAIPTAAQAVLSGFLVGSLVLGASLAIDPTVAWWQYRTPPVRSEDASSWPLCHRLNGWVDGCTYSPAQDMAWERAASLLQMPESQLRQDNRHINESNIPQGSVLIVWRHRGQLHRSNP